MVFTSSAVKKTDKADCIFLVHAKVHGDSAWYYVVVDKLKIPLYQRDVESGYIKDLSYYGKIIYSGWGDKPPEEVKKAVQEEFAPKS